MTWFVSTYLPNISGDVDSTHMVGDRLTDVMTGDPRENDGE